MIVPEWQVIHNELILINYLIHFINDDIVQKKKITQSLISIALAVNNYIGGP